MNRNITLFTNRLKLLLVTIVSTCSLLLSCNTGVTGEIGGIPYKLSKVDSSKNLYIQTKNFSGVIWNSQTKRIFPGKKRPFTPTAEEIIKAEKIFAYYLETGRKGADCFLLTAKSIYPPQHYYRQYIGLYNEKGQKEISFNCFPKDTRGTEWMKRELWVMDGGKSYFSILINISTSTYSLFMVNGLA